MSNESRNPVPFGSSGHQGSFQASGWSGQTAPSSMGSGTVLGHPSGVPDFNRLTISDDQSTESMLNNRHLLALRPISSVSQGEGAPSTQGTGSSGPVADYQMQLKLLEQQNMKRLMMARQEQHQAQPEPSHGIDYSSSLADQGLGSTAIPDAELRLAIAELQQAIDHGDPSQLNVQRMQETLRTVHAQIERANADRRGFLPPRFELLNRIVQKESVVSPNEFGNSHESLLPYLDEPEWILGQQNERQLKCKLPVTNFDLYLEQNKGISFLVFRDFDPAQMGEPGQNSNGTGAQNYVMAAPIATAETIRSISPVLSEVIRTILGSKQEYSSLLQDFKASREIKAPYLFVYHSREELDAIKQGLSPQAQEHMTLLLEYIHIHYDEEYSSADSLLAQGKICAKYARYLFKPGDVLVLQSKRRYQAFVATSWPKLDQTRSKSPSKVADIYRGFEAMERMAPTHSQSANKAPEQNTTQTTKVEEWRFDAWHWIFDGSFWRKQSTLIFDIEIDEPTNDHSTMSVSVGMSANDGTDMVRKKEQNILDLSIFPLKYATPDLAETLRRRGETFWKCRKGRFVSYLETVGPNTQELIEERYIVDLKTYRSLHSETTNNINLIEELDSNAMASDEPPNETFKLLLPPEIKGFNLRRKKWFDLEADRISDIKWNSRAFQSLVIDNKSRDLIRALVSNQITAKKSTDIISGKGNGLILLLHGGPGTGKTLTAESVAEIAQKPLYRVTCGDIGTKAEVVEKYLESVLHLGKIWDCVVLLDEADVFLEQRSLEDLNRNALVSVFLRCLEYNDGIIVLTSNRVGTFDEAFKSRIQLALHYPSLGQYQRLRIWDNFVQRLESFDDGAVDIPDLRAHLEDLSREVMNGRQIRNAITTARQYAEWKGMIMTYEHLKDVIEIAGRFDKYLDDVHGGVNVDAGESTADEGSDWTGLK